MRWNFCILSILLIVLTLSNCLQKIAIHEPAKHEGVNVIPIPLKIQKNNNMFSMNQNTKLVVAQDNSELFDIAAYFAQKIKTATGFDLQIIKDNIQSNFILLKLESSLKSMGEEGYELHVTEEKVVVKAYKPAGLFYGIQTIRQLLPKEIESPQKISSVIQWTIPCVSIHDKPRFPWRGMMLDCCRHFMSKEFVKRYIDLLAYHKMNTLHWYLTEDQGWRIEIKKYPRN